MLSGKMRIRKMLNYEHIMRCAMQQMLNSL